VVIAAFGACSEACRRGYGTKKMDFLRDGAGLLWRLKDPQDVAPKPADAA
jgi:hypothetical protein